MLENAIHTIEDKDIDMNLETDFGMKAVLAPFLLWNKPEGAAAAPAS